MPLGWFPLLPRRARSNREARAAALPDDVRRALHDAPSPPLALPLLLGAAVGVVVCVALGALAWGTLPDRIPSHFGPDGRADGWGGKGTLFIFPFMGVVLFLTMTLMARSPAAYNYPFPITRENARRQAVLAMGLIAWLRFATIWLMAYLEYGVVAAAKSGAALGAWFLPATLALILVPVLAYFVAALRAR
jgi:uncharacterized membrane protein